MQVGWYDGHLLHGRWVFGTARGAAKARNLRARPAASVAHLRGEELGLFVHGEVETLYPVDGDAHPDWPQIHEYLRGVYGDTTFDWSDVVYYRLRPTWMAVYASEPKRLLADWRSLVARALALGQGFRRPPTVVGRGRAGRRCAEHGAQGGALAARRLTCAFCRRAARRDGRA